MGRSLFVGIYRYVYSTGSYVMSVMHNFKLCNLIGLPWNQDCWLSTTNLNSHQTLLPQRVGSGHRLGREGEGWSGVEWGGKCGMDEWGRGIRYATCMGWNLVVWSEGGRGRNKLIEVQAWYEMSKPHRPTIVGCTYMYHTLPTVSSVSDLLSTCTPYQNLEWEWGQGVWIDMDEWVWEEEGIQQV